MDGTVGQRSAHEAAPQTVSGTVVAAAGIAVLMALGVIARAVVDVVELLSTREWSFLASAWRDPGDGEAPVGGDGLGLVGPAGADEAIIASQAYLRVSDLPAAASAAVLAQIILGALTGIVLLILLFLLCRNLIRGIAFDRANTRILSWASAALFVGYLLSTQAGGAASRMALSTIGAEAWTCLIGCPGGAAPAVDYSPYVLALALGVLAGAFRVGERLQKDTEGLV
jgi:hypothetical protein